MKIESTRTARAFHNPVRAPACAAVAVLVLAACSSDENDTADPESLALTAVETTELVITTPTASTASPQTAGVPAEDAVERALGYLAAFSGGDADAVLALHTDDFVLRGAFPGDALGEVALTEWMGPIHQAALGTVWADPECVAADDDGAVTVVECSATMVTGLHAGTNTPGVPSDLTITIAAEGVASVDHRMTSNLGLFGYYGWRELQDPPQIETPASVEEAIELGASDSQFVVEYAAFGVAAVEEMTAAFNAGDLDAFLARFESGTTLFGVRWADAPGVYAALIAADQRYELEDCGPAGILGETLAIECGITVLESLGNSGIEPRGTITAKIAVDGRIRSMSSTIDWAPGNDFRSAFKMWLADAHPDVHNTATWLLDTVPSADDYALVAPYYDQFIAQSDTYPVGS